MAGAPRTGSRPVTRRRTFLAFGTPAIGEPEIQEVVATLRGGWLGTGPRTKAFEEAFKQYQGAGYAMATNSCTSALHLALTLAGVGPGDEVLVPALTFAATANVVVHAGAKPVFVDVDPITMTMDPAGAQAARTDRTKALIPVHFAGRPAAMADLALPDLAIIADAAHAVEMRYHGVPAGLVGDIVAFSFYVTKNLATGDGGMLTTSRADWADRARVRSLHGLSRDAWMRYAQNGDPSYDVVEAGYKYNMMDLVAALGLHQLGRIERNLEIRQRIWARYDSAFARLSGLVLPPPEEPDTRHARHLYTILFDPAVYRGGRNAVAALLREENIGSGVHFPCLPLTTYYRNALGHESGDFPHAESIADRTLSLPLSAGMDGQDVEDVVQAVFRVADRLAG